MADEKEVTVKITTDVDDENVRDLEETLNEINNSEINLGVETDDTSLDDAEAKVDDLDGSSSEVTIDTDDSSVDESESKIDSLDGKEVDVTIGADTSGLEEALTAVSAGVSLAGMENMVATAGNINDSWNRLGLTFGEVTGQMKTDISEAGEATGRSGGLIRQYFNDMGIAGVTNTELLQQSFEALSGRAYQTGNSIESMEQKMKMMVMSGNAGARQLTQLGISTADLGRVMGVSADEASKMFKTLSQEERLRVLTQAMGDGKNANEQYKNSWQGLKDQVDKATSALMGAVGNMILPFLVPAMQVATQTIEALSAGFKALPAPIQGVIGGVGALVMGFLALTTVISTIKAVANAIKFVQTAISLLTTVTRIATAVQEALNLTMLANPYVLVAVAILALVAALVYCYNTNEEFRNSVNQLFNDLQRLASGDWHVVVEYEQKGVDAGVDTAKMLASNDLSQGLSRMLMGDEAVDQANANLDGFLENIKSKLHEGMDAFWNDGTQGILGWLAELAGIDVGSYLQNFMDGFNGIGASITGVIMGIQGFIMNVLQIPVFIQQAVQQGVANFQVFVGQVSGILSSVISNVVSFGSNFVSQLDNSARNAVSAFGSGLSGLVDEAWAEFNDVLQAIYDFGAQAVAAAQNIGQQIVQAIWNRHSPGIMAQATFLETKDSKMFLEQGLSDMIDIARTGSSNIMNGFNLDLNSNIGNTGSNGGTHANGVVNNFNFTFTDFIDDKEKLTDLIIKTITDEINWNNMTANRTV